MTIMFNSIFILTIMNAIMFSLLKHPMTMGFTLIFQTLMITTLMNLSSKSFWFLYILILILIGGLLVLFIYVISVSSNELFNFNLKMMLIIIIISTIMILMFNIMNDFTLLTMENNIYMNNLLINKMQLSETIKLFSFPSNLITISMVNYLFLLLIIIIKITSLFSGPIRKMF